MSKWQKEGAGERVSVCGCSGVGVGQQHVIPKPHEVVVLPAVGGGRVMAEVLESQKQTEN